MNKVSRRLVVKSASSLLALGAPMILRAQPASRQLVVSGWGGTFQDAMRKALFEPFSKETGIRVMEVTYGGQGLARVKAQLDAGKTSDAVDSFEAALAVDPGYTDIYLDLAEAARKDGMQGKAIHYYRVALTVQPDNLAAISGEGEALLEKGAVEKAKRNLAKLETMCGGNCREAKELASAIDNAPRAALVTAEAVTPDPVVTKN